MRGSLSLTEPETNRRLPASGRTLSPKTARGKQKRRISAILIDLAALKK
jgi:hypothetical protein